MENSILLETQIAEERDKKQKISTMLVGRSFVFYPIKALTPTMLKRIDEVAKNGGQFRTPINIK